MILRSEENPLFPFFFFLVMLCFRAVALVRNVYSHVGFQTSECQKMGSLSTRNFEENHGEWRWREKALKPVYKILSGVPLKLTKCWYGLESVL